VPDAEYPAERWKLLGQLLERRRLELGYRHRRGEFETGPLSASLAGELERGDRPNFETGTLAAAEVSYRLATGTIRRFMTGHADRLEPLDDLTAAELARVQRSRQILAQVDVPDLIARIRGDLDTLAEVAEASVVLDRAAG
jgi:hypothetical protein